MKIRFTKNAYGYKADQEVELTADEAKAFGDAVVEVKVDAVAEAVKAFESKIGEVAEKAADEAASKAVEKVAKAFSNRKPSISVGADSIDKDPQKGFKSLGHFAQTLKGFQSNELKAEDRNGFETYLKSTGHNETTDADGGYAVPQIWVNTIFNDIQSQDNLLPLTQQYPMTVGDILNIPCDGTTTIGNGMTAAVVGEGSAINITKTVTRIVQLQPYKLGILTATTEELERDAQSLSAYLMDRGSYQLNYKINNLIVRGAGTTTVTGFIGHAATVTQLRDTANQIKFVDLAKMYARFYGNRNKARWIVNRECFVQLAQMTSGNFNIYLQNSSVAGAPVATIFGIPVMESEHMSSLGSEGDIALVDLSNYLTAVKGGVDMAESVHLYFNTAERAYRWLFRFDGKPARASKLTPASGQGTTTLSPMVVLDDATT